MFDWVWEMFYGITKSMFSLIDNLLACANMLCGIQPITYRGEEMDFIGFLLKNQAITYAFVAARKLKSDRESNLPCAKWCADTRLNFGRDTELIHRKKKFRN